MLVISTMGGAVIDARTWLTVMLSHHYDKPTTLAMMARLSMVHIHEAHTILAFPVGREPDASVLREVYARVMLDHKGVLKSNCASYRFSILGEGELERSNALIAHYGWIEGLADHRDQQALASRS